MSLKDEILSATATATRLVPVPVPEWGSAVVHVRGLTVGEVETLEMRNRALTDDGQHPERARPMSSMLALGVRDADGAALFDFAEAEALAPASVVARLATMVKERTYVGTVEDAAKNSASGRGGASSSPSPSP